MLKLIFRNIKTANQRKAEQHSIKVRAAEFLKHYEESYQAYHDADYSSDVSSFRAIAELEYIGARFFGIEYEAFSLIKYKIEKGLF